MFRPYVDRPQLVVARNNRAEPKDLVGRIHCDQNDLVAARDCAREPFDTLWRDADRGPLLDNFAAVKSRGRPTYCRTMCIYDRQSISRDSRAYSKGSGSHGCAI